MQLIRPNVSSLQSYVAALGRGWAADRTRGPDAVLDELEKIRLAPHAFIARFDDMAGGGEPVILPDGSRVPRLPGFTRWMWDGEFVGTIAFRWQPGTPELPPTCLGHIGYSVVPWKRRQGHATAALRMLLPELRPLGLPWIEITTDPENIASQKVIERAGGILAERFSKPPQLGGTPALRYRIAFD